jgi:hypothetical protein
MIIERILPQSAAQTTEVTEASYFVIIASKF